MGAEGGNGEGRVPGRGRHSHGLGASDEAVFLCLWLEWLDFVLLRLYLVLDFL